MSLLYKIGLIANATMSLPAFAFYVFSFYNFLNAKPDTNIFLSFVLTILSLMSMGYSFWGLRCKENSDSAFWSSSSVGSIPVMVWLLGIPFLNGGEDGPGLFWILFVGGISLLLSGTNILLLIIGGIVRWSKRYDT